MSYRPEIKAEQMERLCFIRDHTGIPIAMLVDDALRAYIPRFLGWLQRDGQRCAAHNAQTHKEVIL
jgi:hypothetical protein